ncbi:ABC transporter ATP-binding protein [Microbulbifer pacificus]|uniref:ATP-binding cassette domain-containing protein n=1 Tax=Microbulbifer pacificus TaxID=407164 RepID=A0AAU0N1F6_9GAMM|nr:ATP-binding cassette domain-containing protein [Microbulbifer pacificus]WOX06817.1 ATP-binding cassette domain-containing protein [Microbulbifer pacificus]
MAKLQLHRVAIGQLNAVDLTISPGEIVCLSGASGSGKTRLLRAIADLEPHAGEVVLGDTEQSALPGHRWRSAVMLVPAESAWWHDTVGEHFSEATNRQFREQTLQKLDLPAEAFDWQVARLSSGEKQRLALARALSRKPVALLLDEPTANLDKDNTQRVETWLCEYIRQQQIPTLWVAHHEDQIQRVADRHFRIVDSGIKERQVTP